MEKPVVRTSVFGEHMNDPGPPILFSADSFPARSHMSDTVVSRLEGVLPVCTPCFGHCGATSRQVLFPVRLPLLHMFCRLCSSGGEGCDSLLHLSLPVGSISAPRSVLGILATV